MGIFDKLFGKKQQVSKEIPTPERKTDTIPGTDISWNSILGGLELPKRESPFLRQITYEEAEQLINNNPLTPKYRRETQQQSTSMHTMEWEDFKEKAKGSFTVLDLETTGLSNLDDEIVEISAVRVRKGEISEIYNQYVFPNIKMPADAQMVNHITDEMLADKPYIFEVLPDLLDFIGSDIIVAHNAAFDFGFIAQACMRNRFKIPRKWFDSMDLKAVWPGLKNKKLQSFLDAAGIENKNAHSATGDAEALALLTIMSLNK